jgi:signal transduction histidine kinase
VLLHRAQEKGLELQYVVEPGVPAQLLGDPLRLAQILVNLIGNALKFTASGSVSVYVRRLAADSDACVRLEFDVQDTGIGMSQSSNGTCSRPSARPTPRSPASSAAPDWAWPSASTSPN